MPLPTVKREEGPTDCVTRLPSLPATLRNIRKDFGEILLETVLVVVVSFGHAEFPVQRLLEGL